MIEKVCSKCKKNKPLTEFYKKNTGRDGLCQECKGCCKQRSKEWQIKNKKKREDYHKQYYIENKGSIQTYKKKYYQENKEKIDKNKKEWAKNNRKKCNKYSKKWKSENPKKVKEQSQADAKRRCDKVLPCYAMQLIVGKSSFLSAKNIPQELVEAKRAHILIKRELKNEQTK